MSYNIAYFTDLHLSDKPPLGRIDDYRQALLNKLTEIGVIARANACATVLFGGDFFHQKRANRVSHGLRTEAGRILNNWRIPVDGVMGNHDQGPAGIASLDDQPIGGLHYNKQLTIHSNPLRLAAAVAVLFRNYDAEREADPDYYQLTEMERDWLDGEKVIMVAHGPLLPPGETRPYPTVDVSEIVGVDLLLSGHIHENLGVMKVGDMTFANPGSVGRFSRTQDNFVRKPTMYIITVPELTITEFEIPGVAPAFEVFEGRPEEAGPGQPSDEVQAFLDTLGKGLQTEEVDPKALMAEMGVEDDAAERALYYYEEAS
jgi:DNA repair exonuclease SbcCD nuclease subunit